MQKDLVQSGENKSLVMQNVRVAYNKNITLAWLEADNSREMAAFEHRHDDYEFIVPLTPIPCLLKDGKVRFGEVGYCYPVASGELHGVKNKLTGAGYLDILIKKDFYEAFMSRTAKPVSSEYEFPFSESLSSYVNNFYTIFESKSQLRIEQLESVSALMCMELIDLAARGGVNEIASKRKYQKGVQAACDYIHAHYNQKLTIETLSAICGFSKYYFIKAFTSFTGDTPIVYLTKFRISRAKYLLANSEMSLAEIAAECGFRTTNNLSAMFKRYVGQTPAKFRG